MFLIIARKLDGAPYRDRGFVVARVSIDAKFFSDPRIKLLSKLCDEELFTTRGRLLQVWFEAYNRISEFMKKDEIEIYSEWSGEGSYSDFLIRSKLAEEIDSETIRIKGLTEKILYLKEARENGKKSAEIRKEKFGTNQPDRWGKIQNSSEGSPKVPSDHPKVGSGSSEPTPTPTPTPTPNNKVSLVSKETEIPIKEKKKRLPKMEKPEDVDFRKKCWEFYDKLRVQLYGNTLLRDATSNSVMKQICAIFKESTPDAIFLYMNDRNKFYIEKTHDLNTMLMDRNKFDTKIKQRKIKSGY